MSAVSRPCQPGDEVEVNLFIRSSHTQEVDIRENFTFILGNNELLPPIESAITSLTEGESRSITFPLAPFFRSEEAAQFSGYSSLSESLTVDISLLAVLDTARKASAGLLPKEDLLAIATTKKNIGNTLLQAQEIFPAISAYSDALTVLRSLGGEWPSFPQERKKLEIACLANLAHAHILVGKFRSAIDYASEVLAIDRFSVKAWYRRGLAHWKFGEVQKAYADVIEAAKLEPTNTEIRALLETIKAGL